MNQESQREIVKLSRSKHRVGVWTTKCARQVRPCSAVTGELADTWPPTGQVDIQAGHSRWRPGRDKLIVFEIWLDPCHTARNRQALHLNLKRDNLICADRLKPPINHYHRGVHDDEAEYARRGSAHHLSRRPIVVSRQVHDDCHFLMIWIQGPPPRTLAHRWHGFSDAGPSLSRPCHSVFSIVAPSSPERFTTPVSTLQRRLLHPWWAFPQLHLW